MTDTISFISSKIFWMVLIPSHLILILLAVTFLIRKGILRAVFQGLITGLLAVCMLMPLGEWALLPLEQCFANRTPPMEKIDGIVVLGGAVDARISKARSAIAFNGSADRIMGLIRAIIKYPGIPVIYSGGSGDILNPEFDEAGMVKAYLEENAIGTERFYAESASRNTYENAVYSVAAMGDVKDQHWLLLTSAFHMPRALALFDKAGASRNIQFSPLVYDYKTPGTFRAELTFDFTGTLAKLDLAAKEYLGLALNYVMGKSSALWPCSPAEQEGL